MCDGPEGVTITVIISESKTYNETFKKTKRHHAVGSNTTVLYNIILIT